MGLKALIYCMKAMGGHASMFMGGFDGEKETRKVADIAWGNLCFLAPHRLGNCRQEGIEFK